LKATRKLFVKLPVLAHEAPNGRWGLCTINERNDAPSTFAIADGPEVNSERLQHDLLGNLLPGQFFADSTRLVNSRFAVRDFLNCFRGTTTSNVAPETDQLMTPLEPLLVFRLLSENSYLLMT